MHLQQVLDSWPNRIVIIIKSQLQCAWPAFKLCFIYRTKIIVSQYKFLISFVFILWSTFKIYGRSFGYQHQSNTVLYNAFHILGFLYDSNCLTSRKQASSQRHIFWCFFSLFIFKTFNRKQGDNPAQRSKGYWEWMKENFKDNRYIGIRVIGDGYLQYI